MSYSKHEGIGEFELMKDGVPIWDAEDMSFLEEYKARAYAEYEKVDAEESPEQKTSLGIRLTRGSSGKEWKAVRHFLKDATGRAKLKTDGGQEEAIKCLSGWTSR